MDFMMSCDGMKPPITSGGGGGGLQWPNNSLIEHFSIFSAAGCDAICPSKDRAATLAVDRSRSLILSGGLQHTS